MADDELYSHKSEYRLRAGLDGLYEYISQRPNSGRLCGDLDLHGHGCKYRDVYFFKFHDYDFSDLRHI